MDGFKQRIIGALVLICLAVIFVPMLFQKPHNKSATQTIQIPSEPQSQSITIEKPKAPPVNGGGQASASAGMTSGGMSSSGTANGSTAGMSATPATSAAPSGMAESSGNAGQGTPQAQAPSSASGQSTEAQPQAPAAPEKPASAQPARATAQAPAAKVQAKPQGKWVVQLGSFGEEKNADRLRAKVRSKGYAAFLTKAQAGGRALTRVFAGPFADKSDAVSAKQALDRDFSIKSLVMANPRDK